jgi:DNA-binding beta-propeller fold protein YncE
VTVIDGATNSTTTVAVSQGNWWGTYPMAVDPNTDKIYVANSGSNGTVTVIDGRTATSDSLASNLNPSPLNAKVTFTASVTANLGTSIPTGTVSFEDGSTLLGTGTLNASGVATFATSSLIAGQHSITAVYGGDGNSIGSTSSVLAQTVNQQADFALAAITTSLTVAAGSSGKFALTVTPQGSFTTAISFSCSGLPALAGCTFSPASVTPNSSTVNTTLNITTTAYTASLARPFGRHSSPLYAIWLVLPAMLLGTVGLAPSKRRKLLSYCIVFLLVSGCLLQVACSGTSNSSGGGGTSGTPAGTYTITVTGAAGATQHAATVTLRVQ